MQSFVIAILTKVLSDPDVQKWIKNLLSEIITEKVAPLVPLAAASAAHAMADLMPAVTHDIEDVAATANKIRDDLNNSIPQFKTGIPLIDDAVNAWRPQ